MRGAPCKKEDAIAWKDRTEELGASDIDVDSNGQVYIAGQDGGVYKRERTSWSESMGTDAKRIAVTPNGEIFIVTNDDEVKSLSRTDTEWKSYTMEASDVGAGANGQVWIANSAGKAAFLNAEGKFYVYGNTPCHADRITVEFNGQPWITCKNNDIYRSINHDHSGQKWVKFAGKAMDIAAGPSGDVLIIGQD